MASYRAIPTTRTTSKSAHLDDSNSNDPSPSSTNDFKRVEFRLVCPFNIPSTPEAASLRVIRNLSHFALYYTHFIWIILFITLIPARKVSLICLVIMTYVASLYLLLLRAVPSSYVVIHKVLDKRTVLPVVVAATMAVLIFTDSGLHLVLTLAGSVPLVLVHAVLWIREDDFSVEDHKPCSSGKLLPITHDDSANFVV